MARKPREAELWLAGIGLFVLVLQVLAFHGVRHDDAYISYRYAQNLATGNGLVFNEGDRLMGSTAPGHVLLAAAVYVGVGKQGLPAAMSVLGCIAWSLQAAAVYFLLRRALGLWVASGVAACIAAGAAMSHNWVALETNFAVALTLWAIVLARQDRWVLAGATGALAGLVRPDAYLVCVLLGISCLVGKRKQLWRFAATVILTSLPWLTFSLIYFGDVLPRSASAKFQSVGFGEYARYVASYPASVAVPFGRPGAWTAVAWLVAIVGAVLLVRRQKDLWILPAYAGLHLLSYVVLRPPVEHQWHLYPAVVLLVVLCLGAIGSLGAAAGKAPVRFAITLVLLLGMLSGYAIRTSDWATRHATFYWFGARDAAYRELANYLVEHADPDDVVASYEVGTIGYYSELEIHDWFGLITRDPDRLPAEGVWMVSFWEQLEEAEGHPPRAAFNPAGFPAYLYDRRTADR